MLGTDKGHAHTHTLALAHSNTNPKWKWTQTHTQRPFWAWSALGKWNFEGQNGKCLGVIVHIV